MSTQHECKRNTVSHRLKVGFQSVLLLLQKKFAMDVAVLLSSNWYKETYIL